MITAVRFNVENYTKYETIDTFGKESSFLRSYKKFHTYGSMVLNIFSLDNLRFASYELPSYLNYMIWYSIRFLRNFAISQVESNSFHEY